jgi:hypothetical protein
MSDPLNDPRFPDRPNHPDFWRLAEVGMAHDADAIEKRGGLQQVIASIIDERSLLYAAEHRLGNGGALTPGMSSMQKARLMAIFVDAFCLGADFIKRGGHRED